MSVLSPAPLAELIRSAKFRVRPEKWTQTHLDLVGCRFEDAELGQVNTSSHNEQLSSASRASQEPSNFLDDRDDEDQQLRNRHLIVRLQHSRAELKLQLMEQLLLTDGESLFSFVFNDVKFYWCGRPADHPKMRVFCGREIRGAQRGESKFFLVGYYAHTHDGAKCYHCRWFKKSKKSRAKIRSPRSFSEECPMAQWPPNAYILSILIALAQAQDHLNSETYGRAPSQKVRLLVSNPAHKEMIHYYEATILDGVLEAMFKPNLATEYIQWPTVTHQTIKYQSRETFKARLHAYIAPASALRLPATAASSQD